jgi:hypothetical protein
MVLKGRVIVKAIEVMSHLPLKECPERARLKVREATMGEIPGTWDELEGMVDDLRYVQETRNLETEEWENPVYIGTVNPNVESWENVDTVKNFDTGEQYTDEE